jgi:hypothetical protein
MSGKVQEGILAVLAWINLNELYSRLTRAPYIPDALAYLTISIPREYRTLTALTAFSREMKERRIEDLTRSTKLLG